MGESELLRITLSFLSEIVAILIVKVNMRLLLRVSKGHHEIWVVRVDKVKLLHLNSNNSLNIDSIRQSFGLFNGVFCVLFSRV